MKRNNENNKTTQSSVHELFEKAIGAALDDHFCQIMKSKYTEYCVRNIKYASALWSTVERLSPWMWALNLFFNLLLIAYAFVFHQYTFAVLFSCTFLLLNILLTYQFVKIYCRSDNIDATKLVLIFMIGFLFGFTIPLFSYCHYHYKWLQLKLVTFIRTDIDESSLNDFSANVPIRPSCWGFAIHSITFTLPFTFLQVLMMIVDKENNDNIEMVAILFINMLTLLLNSWCLIFTRTDRYAFVFAWICVVLDTFSGVLSILLTFYLSPDASVGGYNGNGQEDHSNGDNRTGGHSVEFSETVQFLHHCWWFKIYICGILSLGFEFLNIAESWEHITSGFFELLDHFRSYVSPIPRVQCLGAILAIIFISLGGLIIFFIFQTLGMVIFMFALYFLNWSWCLSLLDDQVMHEFDELYSSLIHFIMSAHNDDDYALRLSVVNFELNPFTKKVKHVNYELLDMVHLRPKDWLFHGKKYFSEHFLWGAIGGYHYQREKWLDLNEEYRISQQVNMANVNHPTVNGPTFNITNNSNGNVAGNPTVHGNDVSNTGDNANGNGSVGGRVSEERNGPNGGSESLTDPMNVSHHTDNDDGGDNIGGGDVSNGQHTDSSREEVTVDIPFNEKFPRLFWIGFFGCSAYIFQPLYTFVILFSNVYPLIVYVSVTTSTPECVPMVVHIMMAIYLLLIPCFVKYLYKAAGFAHVLFHIVSARKKLYKRPRQLFEAQDSMKFFARVWKHYIYVHVTLLRNQMVEEYFGDLYKEVLSLLSPLQRMDNLIELYEEMYSSQCGRVKIKFADWVTEEDHEHKRDGNHGHDGVNGLISATESKGTRLLQSLSDHQSAMTSLTTRAPIIQMGPLRTAAVSMADSNGSQHQHHRRRNPRNRNTATSRRSSRGTSRGHISSSSSSSSSSSNGPSSKIRGSRSSRKQNGHHNALLFDAQTKKKRRLRRNKRTLLLDRSLIDLIDANAGSDLNGRRGDNNVDDDDDDDDDLMLRPHGLRHHHHHHRESTDEFEQFDGGIGRDVVEEEEDGVYRFSDHEDNEEDERRRHRAHRNNPGVELQIAERGNHRRVQSNSLSSLF